VESEQEAMSKDQMIYLPPDTPQGLVAEFYREKRGSVPSLEEAADYLEEEYWEVDKELFKWEGDINVSRQWVPRLVEEVDRAHLAKELADVLFTAYGVAIAAGIDLDKAFELVCISNMTKERTPEGKVQKGEAYQEPDMSEALL